MPTVRGLPSIKTLMGLGAGALIVPLALLLAEEIGAVMACIYWSIAVAIPVAASVV